MENFPKFIRNCTVIFKKTKREEMLKRRRRWKTIRTVFMTIAGQENCVVEFIVSVVSGGRGAFPKDLGLLYASLEGGFDLSEACHNFDRTLIDIFMSSLWSSSHHSQKSDSQTVHYVFSKLVLRNQFTFLATTQQLQRTAF